MRKSFFNLILVITLVGLIQNVSAINYNSYIGFSISPETPNTSLNIKGAQLIEKYVKNLKISVEEVKEKYEILNDKKLNTAIQTLGSMTFALDRIQTKNIEKNDVDEVMKSIIKDLKILTSEIKILLKERKETFEFELKNKKEAYSKIGNKLGKNLDKIIFRIAGPLKGKRNLDVNETLLVDYLKSLTNESDKLKNLNNVNFQSKSEIKSAIIKILKKIKSDIIGIKNIKY